MDPRIKQARRLQQPALVALWGASSSGKTYSALQLAHGMCREDQKIGMIDTENKRGQAHVGTIPRPYYTFDIDVPFTADKYIDAFKAFENDEEFGLVIIDSYSHAWVGEGGALDQADGNTSKGLAKWLNPKSHINRLLNVLMRSRLHVIVCMREKMAKGQDYKGTNGALRIFDTGFVPIAEQNTMFEMGVSFWLGMNHKPIFKQPSERCFTHERIPMIKAPPAIESQLREEEFLSPRHGKMIADWYRGDSYDLTEQGLRAAARGTDSLNAWVASLVPAHKAELIKLNLGLKIIAAKADSDEADRNANIEREKLEQEAKQNDQSSDDGGNAFLDQFTEQSVPAQAEVQPASHTANMADDMAPEFPVPETAAVVPQPNATPVATQPPAPATAPVAQTREQLIARFTNSLNTVDWFYQMADDGNAFRRGEQEVNTLLSLAKSLGPEFVAQFEAKKAAMWRRTDPQATVAPQAEPVPKATPAPAPARHVPTDTNPF